MEQQISLLEKNMKEKQEAYNLKKRTADLLPDVENNTAKLQVPGPNYHDVFFSLNRSPIHQTTIVCTAFFSCSNTQLLVLALSLVKVTHM